MAGLVPPEFFTPGDIFVPGKADTQPSCNIKDIKKQSYEKLTNKHGV